MTFNQGPILSKPARVARLRLAALLDLLCVRFECLVLVLRTENSNRLAYNLMRGISIENFRTWVPILNDEVRRKRIDRLAD